MVVSDRYAIIELYYACSSIYIADEWIFARIFGSTYMNTSISIIIPGSRSYSGINEGIMWATIVMGVIIAILISLALCYLAREKYKKRQEYYINA